jgi:RNA 2',3'-cyclic 3'-phosphodiesterase
METDEIRLFIAVELPGELKAAIKEYQGRLSAPGMKCARWVSPDSIHLTLKFLGQTDPKLIDAIGQRLTEDTKLVRNFVLKTGGVGFFPNANRMRVFWLGLEGQTDVLLTLQSKIEDSMARLRFPKEGRLFTAHLTLARIREECGAAERQRFAELAGKTPFTLSYTWCVDSVSLVRSQLTPRGPIYTRLFASSLADER